MLDRMEMYEVKSLLSHQHLRCRESWEQTRLLAFVNARCAGSKITDVKKLFKLPWDDAPRFEKSAAGKSPATDAELSRLKGMAQYIINNDLLKESYGTN